MSDPWYLDACQTWNRVLDTSALRHADKDFLVCGSQRISFGEFRRRTLDFAKGLMH